MRKLVILCIVGFVFSIISIVSAVLLIYPNNTAENKLKFHPVSFYERTTFLEGVEEVKNKKIPFNKKISGGIIPHHLLPGSMIAGFFHLLQKQNPKTIILIGPNHYEKGEFKVLTSNYGWETPYGNVLPDLKKINQLTKANTVMIDNTVLPGDHAVAGSLPFLKYYLPDTKIVPLLLSGFMNIDEIYQLKKSIEKVIDDDTVVIAAVDFSHYLSIEEAEKNDAVTLALMKDHNYKGLLSLNNDFMDSPPSIVTLLMVMKSRGSDQISVLQHNNSGKITKNNREGTTSYYSIVFY